MSISATLVHAIPLGPRMKAAIVTVAMDNSTLAAGETLDLSAIFDTAVYGGIPIEYDADGLYILRYDRAASGAPATGKVMPIWCDYDAVADGDLIAVPDTTDLSALSGYWIFLGY